WLRCAFVLLRGQYLPCPEEVLLNPTPPLPANPRLSWHPPPDRKSKQNIDEEKRQRRAAHDNLHEVPLLYQNQTRITPEALKTAASTAPGPSARAAAAWPKPAATNLPPAN